MIQGETDKIWLTIVILFLHYSRIVTVTVCSVSQQIVNIFWWPFTEGWSFAEGLTSHILVLIQFRIPIHVFWILISPIMKTTLFS